MHMDRLSHIANEVVTLGASAFCTMLAATAALLPNATVETSEGTLPVVIMDDEKMRLICIVGAIGGGVITTLLSAEKDTSLRALITRIVISTGCGIMFTPWFFWWQGWVPNTDKLLAASGMVSLLAVGVLKTILPLWERYVAKRLSPPQ